MPEKLRIEVAHGGEQDVVVIRLDVEKGTTVNQAIEQSGILARFPGLEPEQNGVGIFARRVTPDTLVSHGDRIEIYRPIRADAKEVRRRRASRQRRDQD
ncbi:MAG: RnfH family protein [Gammaproteobacteria bacterium]